MVLKVLGSGSSGNCYLLENETECLVIEAGLPFLEVKKALGYDITKIVGVIITHCHADHSKYAKEYERAGIPVYKPYETNSTSVFRGIGNKFMIQPFPLQDKNGNWTHSNGDGTPCPCYGFLISHKEIGNLAYVTDTQFVKWRFNNANHLLVEANYDMDLIDMNEAKFRHVMQGHMSIQTALGFIKANISNNLKTIILCHLSYDNSNADNFRESVEQIYSGTVEIANRGLKLNLDLIPF